MGKYAQHYFVSILGVYEEGVDGFAGLSAVTKKSAAGREMKPGVQSWHPDRHLQPNLLSEVLYRNIPASKNLQTRCEEKREAWVKCLAQGKSVAEFI